MDLPLKPRAEVCCASGVAFREGDRVVSALVLEGGEYRRFDWLEASGASFQPPGDPLCRWTRIFKRAPTEVNPERALKLTAESLFLSLTEEGCALEENVQLKQFLALLLERKRILKRRGVSSSGGTLYEHPATQRMIEVPPGEMDAEFFVQVREKLGVLVGEPAALAAPNPSAVPPQ